MINYYMNNFCRSFLRSSINVKFTVFTVIFVIAFCVCCGKKNNNTELSPVSFDAVEADPVQVSHLDYETNVENLTSEELRQYVLGLKKTYDINRLALIKLKLTNRILCSKAAEYLSSCKIKHPLSSSYLAPVISGCKNFKAAAVNISLNAMDQKWKLRFNNMYLSQAFSDSASSLELTDLNNIPVESSSQWSLVESLELIPQSAEVIDIDIQKIQDLNLQIEIDGFTLIKTQYFRAQVNDAKDGFKIFGLEKSVDKALETPGCHIDHIATITRQIDKQMKDQLKEYQDDGNTSS